MTVCSESSVAAEETMAGTAGDALRHWVAIEVRGPWRPKCVLDNTLPEATQAWLRELQARPGVRPVFIKQRRKKQGVTVLYADVIDGRVHRFDLVDHNFVHMLPWDALMAGEIALGRTDERPILVCTHGTRDHCCGLHGPAFTRALSQLAGPRVWQSSHLGGHRYAATMVALPQGVHYGRLRATEAPEVLAALNRGELHRLDRFRGRTWLPRPVQAAEAWLRELQREPELKLEKSVSSTMLLRIWTMSRDSPRRS